MSGERKLLWSARFVYERTPRCRRFIDRRGLEFCFLWLFVLFSNLLFRRLRIIRCVVFEQVSEEIEFSFFSSRFRTSRRG